MQTTGRNKSHETDYRSTSQKPDLMDEQTDEQKTMNRQTTSENIMNERADE